MNRPRIPLFPALGLLLLPALWAAAHEPLPPGQTNALLVQSIPGDNAWNAGRSPGDWWEEIKRQHGHVGPWNVLGWRIAQAALREFKTEWGRHDLEIICYLPPQTPFTCLVDGIAVGAGNSLGRLDLRLREVFDARQSFIAVRRKNANGPILEFRPQLEYLNSILNQPLSKLEALSKQCAQLPEKQLFNIITISPNP